jgi:hypothetical protein
MPASIPAGCYRMSAHGSLIGLRGNAIRHAGRMAGMMARKEANHEIPVVDPVAPKRGATGLRVDAARSA